MAENGGPIFEGSANFTPPKKGLAEKLKQKVSKEQLSQTANNVRERIANRLKQNTGEIVEQKWMNAYQRVVDATDPGLRKKALEKVQLAAKGWAKLNRGAAATNDFLIQVFGSAAVVQGSVDLVKPGIGPFTTGSRREGAKLAGEGLIHFLLGKNRISRVASGWMADVAGAGAEKYVQIQNKILKKIPTFSGRSKSEAMPV